MSAPDIKNSTKEEREEYIRNTHKCIADCENCGQCKVFHGKTPEVAYSDYIEGKRSYAEVSMDFRR